MSKKDKKNKKNKKQKNDLSDDTKKVKKVRKKAEKWSKLPLGHESRFIQLSKTFVTETDALLKKIQSCMDYDHVAEWLDDVAEQAVEVALKTGAAFVRPNHEFYVCLDCVDGHSKAYGPYFRRPDRIDGRDDAVLEMYDPCDRGPFEVKAEPAPTKKTKASKKRKT